MYENNLSSIGEYCDYFSSKKIPYTLDDAGTNISVKASLHIKEPEESLRSVELTIQDDDGSLKAEYSGGTIKFSGPSIADAIRYFLLDMSHYNGTYTQDP